MSKTILIAFPLLIMSCTKEQSSPTVHTKQPTCGCKDPKALNYQQDVEVNDPTKCKYTWQKYTGTWNAVQTVDDFDGYCTHVYSLDTFRLLINVVNKDSNLFSTKSGRMVVGDNQIHGLAQNVMRFPIVYSPATYGHVGYWLSSGEDTLFFSWSSSMGHRGCNPWTRSKGYATRYIVVKE